MALSRDEIRKALVGNTPLAEQRDVTIFDIPLVIRQPSLRDIMRARSEDDEAKRMADIIIRYVYIPGGDERAFEEGDAEMIMRWPWGEDLSVLQDAIMDLSGLNIDDAEEELKTDPLDE